MLVRFQVSLPIAQKMRSYLQVSFKKFKNGESVCEIYIYLELE
jgi:hypothetical protein